MDFGILKRTAVAGAICAMGLGQAQAVSFTQGDWTLDINGTVNAFLVTGKEKVSGGGTTKQSNIQNGLLPGWINFVATTQQKGYDIKAHISFAPGITENSNIVGLPSGAASDLADAYPKSDTRQVYFQFGTPDMGTFKLGRDIGLFMQNPILSDMTLLGVGGTVRAAEPFNTSFGMIGHGYMYPGFQAQITYTTPKAGGFQGSIGMFNPKQILTNDSGAVIGERRSPGVQALVSYDWEAGAPGKVWLAALNQRVNSTDTTPAVRSTGYEGGVKVGLGGAEVLLSGFRGKGLGISTVGALFLGSANAAGDELKSSGVFTQATYKLTQDLKLGVSYGQNRDKDLVAVGTDTKRKANAFGAYYSLTPAITLVGEYIRERTDNAGAPGGEVKAQAVSLGGILFF